VLKIAPAIFSFLIRSKTGFYGIRIEKHRQNIKCNQFRISGSTKMNSYETWKKVSGFPHLLDYSTVGLMAVTVLRVSPASP